MKKQSADKRRVVACPVEFLRQLGAVNVAAVDHVRRAVCKADAFMICGLFGRSRKAVRMQRSSNCALRLLTLS